MDEILQIDIEAFPDFSTIYLKAEPIEPNDNSSFFEIEIPRDEITLAKFLRKLKPLIDLETPMVSFKAFAREALSKNLTSCYCPSSNLNNIIELYHNREITPEKEFPGSEEGDRADMYKALYPGVGEAFITENIKINKNRDVWINNRLIKEGSTISFYYKGSVE